VVLIRNPVDRAWSHAKKDLGRKRSRSVREIPDAEFESFFADPYQRKLARYHDIVDNWSAYLADGHLFTGLFDDVARRPEELLSQLFSFLGISNDDRYTHRVARQLVNRTESTGIPEKHRQFLEDLLRPELDMLSDRFGFTWPRS